MKIHLMNANIILQQPQVSGEKSLLAVSILLPVQTTITRNQLEYRLKLLELKVEEQLLNHYPEKQTAPVITKLKHVIGNLDYRTHKKGIAIFVSTVSEKVYYLEARVEEKIAIDEVFESQDEIFTKARTAKIS